MADGGWRMADGGWRMADGGSRGCSRTRWDGREKKEPRENRRARVYVRGKPGELSRATDATWEQGGHRGTNTIKEVEGANDAEWTRNGANVEREEEMTLENKTDDAELEGKKKRRVKKNRNHLSARCTRAKVASSRMKGRREGD